LEQEQAVQKASAYVMEDPLVSNLLGFVQGLAWFLIVFLLVRRLEKRPFFWKDFGLDWRAGTPTAIGLGIVLGFAFTAAYMLLSRIFETTSVTWTGAPLQIVLLIVLNYISIGFGEEIAFRAFLQDRFIARFKPGMGVILTALCFVPLHLLTQQMSLTTLISGLLLWFAIGALYYRTRSLFLVGTLHAVLNSLPILFNIQVNSMASLIVHALAIMVVLVLLRNSQTLNTAQTV
jgi:membrane protease YdiL (CAAX protease family)